MVNGRTKLQVKSNSRPRIRFNITVKENVLNLSTRFASSYVQTSNPFASRAFIHARARSVSNLFGPGIYFPTIYTSSTK